MTEEEREGMDRARQLAELGALEAELKLNYADIRALQGQIRLMGQEIGSLRGQVDYLHGLLNSHSHKGLPDLS